MKDLKDRFKEIRVSLAISQAVIAEKMNRTQPNYSKLETGETEIKISDLDSFSRAVNMSVIDVLTWPEKWVPEKSNYTNKIEPEIVEEYYRNCKECAEKDRRIIDLKENLKDLRTQLEYFQAQLRRTGSG